MTVWSCWLVDRKARIEEEGGGAHLLGQTLSWTINVIVSVASNWVHVSEPLGSFFKAYRNLSISRPVSNPKYSGISETFWVHRMGGNNLRNEEEWNVCYPLEDSAWRRWSERPLFSVMIVILVLVLKEIEHSPLPSSLPSMQAIAGFFASLLIRILIVTKKTSCTI